MDQGAGQRRVGEMTPTELQRRMEAGEDVLLVDVREGFERDIADLPDFRQIHIPVADFVERVEELDATREIVLYCRSGQRSGMAAQYLAGLGYPNVWNLQGGVLAWREEIDPSLTAY